MILRSLSALVLGAMVIGPAFSQDNFPDTPKNHWVIEDLARLKKDGLLVGYPDGLGRPHQPSRYDLAIQIYAVYTNLHAVEAGMESGAKQVSLLPVGVKATQAKRDAELQSIALKANVAYWEPEFEKLVNEFNKELAALQANPEEMKSNAHGIFAAINRCQVPQPGSALVQFSDIPANHWAAKQVLELRQLGILTGYPSTDSTPNTFNEGR